MTPDEFQAAKETTIKGETRKAMAEIQRGYFRPDQLDLIQENLEKGIRQAVELVGALQKES